MKTADVLLILEGTFPYVRGGVSSWIDQLLKAHTDLTFSIVYLGGDREAAQTKHYEIPPNVISMQEIFLCERPVARDFVPASLDETTSEELRERLSAICFASNDTERVQAVFAFSDWLAVEGSVVRLGNLLHGPEAWDVFCEFYRRSLEPISFIDFFWTCRLMMQPLWKLLGLLRNMPPALVYHSICTGYAGVLGAVASKRNGRPFLLSEHGIYTKERIIDINQANWIHEPTGSAFLSAPVRLALKNLWVNLFLTLGKMTYQVADPIITLYSGNARLQVEYGAERRKIQIIPNGIDTKPFDAAREKRAQSREANPSLCRIGFVGRVVPIKDVKTLLRAGQLLKDTLPNAKITLYGPTGEDPDYFAECLEMKTALGLDEMVHFPGPGKVSELLADVDILVLTSVSEALPLVILEAYACKIPVVVTDVGACRELVSGGKPEDKALGRAGMITGISSPAETAFALATLGSNREEQDMMGAAGYERAIRYYSATAVMGRYSELYNNLKNQRNKSWQE